LPKKFIRLVLDSSYTAMLQSNTSSSI